MIKKRLIQLIPGMKTKEEKAKERKEIIETASRMAEEIYGKQKIEFYKEYFPEIKGRCQHQAQVAFNSLKWEGSVVSPDMVESVAEDLFKERVNQRQEDYRKAAKEYKETLKGFGELLLKYEGHEKAEKLLNKMASVHEEKEHYTPTKEMPAAFWNNAEELNHTFTNMMSSYRRLCCAPYEELGVTESDLPFDAWEIREKVPSMPTKEALEGLGRILDQYER